MLLYLCLLISHVLGHGRLVKPIPRFGTGSNNGNDNGPVSGPSGDDFVCRHPLSENTQPLLDLTAGQDLTLQWDFSAAHVGDCSLYVSYDVLVDRPSQKWFKIANLYKCKDQNRQDVAVTLPAWLPAGQVTFRWDWWGLHQFPGVEYYSQCFDATITAGSNPAPVGDIFTYTIPDLYPANGNTEEGFRNPFGGGALGPMTGPPCALNYQGNDCARTACGMEKFIDVRGTYNGGRRRLCADIKPTEECVNSMANWDICADSYWSEQCQATCNLCSGTDGDSGNDGGDSGNDSGNNGGDSGNDSGNNGGDSGDSGNSGDVAVGCDAYAYSGSGGDNADGSSGDGDNASPALGVTMILLSLVCVFV